VTQPRGDDGDGHALQMEKGAAGMPGVVKADATKARRAQEGFPARGQRLRVERGAELVDNDEAAAVVGPAR
jgi:hypothetical protein